MIRSLDGFRAGPCAQLAPPETERTCCTKFPLGQHRCPRSDRAERTGRDPGPKSRSCDSRRAIRRSLKSPASPRRACASSWKRVADRQDAAEPERLRRPYARDGTDRERAGPLGPRRGILRDREPSATPVATRLEPRPRSFDGEPHDVARSSDPLGYASGCAPRLPCSAGLHSLATSGGASAAC
jgi:hypothetical protein